MPTFFGQPYLTLLALFAHTVFEVGPEGLGFLTSCAAAGSVSGALMLAAFPRMAASGRAMLVFLVAFGLLLCAFALNPVFALAPFLLFGVGRHADRLQRVEQHGPADAGPQPCAGRVTSVLLLNRGLVQLGAAASAAAAGFIGVRYAVAATGGFILLFGAGVLLGSRRIRAIQG